MRAAFLFVVLLFSHLALADMIEVAPNLVDPETVQATSKHYAIYNPGQAAPYLLISIGGTSSTTAQFFQFNRLAAQLGYQVISVDYPNAVISTTCRDISPSCFDTYRDEIIFGHPVSEIVNVNPKNSLLYRIESLVGYLATKVDKAAWGPFLANGHINWKRVVLAGHSQGAGHAAYLSKLFPTHGVILFSGPHDYSAKGPASWLLGRSATRQTNILALLQEKDFFGSDSQIAACQVLMNHARIEKIDAEVHDTEAQIYLSHAPAADPHNSVLLPLFSKVWKSLLLRLKESP